MTKRLRRSIWRYGLCSSRASNETLHPSFANAGRTKPGWLAPCCCRFRL